MKNYLFLFLLLFVTLVSCQKETTEPEKTEADYLTEKPWKPYHLDGDKPSLCHQDDVLEFATDSKVLYDSNETSCGDDYSIIPCDTDGLKWYGSWADKKLTFEEDNGEVVIFDIESVTENRLDLYNEDTGYLVFQH